jgi:integrase
LNFVLYDLRHTFATRAAQTGIDLATLAQILGHSGLRVAMKYVHPTAEHRKAAMLKYGQTMTMQEATKQ